MYGILKLHVTRKTIPEHNGKKKQYDLLFIYIIIDISVYTSRYKNLGDI